MSERLAGDARELIIYPPGVTPKPYSPPWDRKKPRERTED